nr:hypothetical protein [Wolbachia endosymbiont of Atemnus politus]
MNTIFFCVLMLFNSIFLGFSLLLYFITKRNRKLSEEKANLEGNLCKLECELQKTKQTLLNKDEEIVDLKIKMKNSK